MHRILWQISIDVTLILGTQLSWWHFEVFFTRSTLQDAWYSILWILYSVTEKTYVCGLYQSNFLPVISTILRNVWKSSVGSILSYHLSHIFGSQLKKSSNHWWRNYVTVVSINWRKYIYLYMTKTKDTYITKRAIKTKPSNFFYFFRTIFLPEIRRIARNNAMGFLLRNVEPTILLNLCFVDV